MTRGAFEELVRRTIEDLPAEVRTRIVDLPVVVRDEPSAAERKAAGIRRDEDLFGLFQGEGATEQSILDLPRMPDRIVIYRRPLERAFPDPAELAVEIRTTILHEVGHALGMDERRMRRLGYS